MNKKAYIKPQMEVIEVDTETLMLGLSGGNSLDGTSDGGSAGSSTGNGPKDSDANGRRGEWGNLWA